MASIPRPDRPTHGLKLIARRQRAALIVLGARRASFWLTRVEGGLTPALLAHAKCPVLAIS